MFVQIPSYIIKILLSKQEYVDCFIDILSFQRVNFNELHKLKAMFLQWNLSTYVDLLLDLEKFDIYFRNKGYSSLQSIPDFEQQEILNKIRPFSVIDGDLTNTTLNVYSSQALNSIQQDMLYVKTIVDQINHKMELPSEDLTLLIEIISKIHPKLPVETTQFKTIYHEILCSKFESFLRKKLRNINIVFEIQNMHSLRDKGVDILLIFTRSNLKIGFQLKSYGDIEKKDFSVTVHTQITTSKSLCDYYFVAFAGDMTDKSHQEKVNGKISDIQLLETIFVPRF